MNDPSSINPLTGADKLAIVSDYIAGQPTVGNSQELAKRIADARGVKITTIRYVLVKAGVYVAQPKPRKSIMESDKDALLAVYNSATALEKIDILWQDGVAKRFNYQSNTIGDFFFAVKQEKRRLLQASSAPKSSGRWGGGPSFTGVPKNPVQYSFQQKLNGEAGWFGNPLWLINTMFVIFLIALVWVGIGSIFK